MGLVFIERIHCFAFRPNDTMPFFCCVSKGGRFALNEIYLDLAGVLMWDDFGYSESSEMKIVDISDILGAVLFEHYGIVECIRFPDPLGVKE